MPDLSPAAARGIADAVLVIHSLFIAFVVFGQVYVLAGWALGWRAARNIWFRRLHLGAIGLVVVEAWAGVVCPLTSLEAHLRNQAGQTDYGQSFIGYWLARLIYYDFPAWVFLVAYTGFGILVLITYWRYPPVAPGEKARASASGS
ncbi:MAG: DUF2784 domain-containing protein [Gammaproteobacteria bacterium]|nr:DUF2784 domain-containing protein [Gammaproteobacteria bacterium]